MSEKEERLRTESEEEMKYRFFELYEQEHSEPNPYYNSNWIIINKKHMEEIFRDKFIISIDEMMSYFGEEKVQITDSNIIDFLNNKAYEKGIDVNSLLKGFYESETEKNILQIKYTYNGYDRKYFEEIIDTLSYHGIKLCMAIKNISDINNSVILTKLGIEIENKCVKKSDIDKLLEVIGYIYFEVRSLTIRANDLNTYTGTVINWPAIADQNMFEKDLYPSNDTKKFYMSNPPYTRKCKI